MIALIRTEFTKAASRTRSLVILLLLIGLPTLIVVAINARSDRPDRDGGEGLFRLASQSGLLVPAAVLSATSGFLLIVIAGTFAGDSVASDANWGNLRYLLMRPVSRARLLIAKAFVAGVLIWAATILVTLAALIAGLILFGAHPVTIPSLGGLLGTFNISGGALALRVLIATAYVAFGFSALLAIGTLFSTLTDTAASAIGATVGVLHRVGDPQQHHPTRPGAVCLPDPLLRCVGDDVHAEHVLKGNDRRDRRAGRVLGRCRRCRRRRLRPQRHPLLIVAPRKRPHLDAWRKYWKRVGAIRSSELGRRSCARCDRAA